MSDIPWIIARNRYGRYCVPRCSAHRPSAKAALEGRVWEPGTVEFLRRNLGGGDIVHAGTYYGDFLPALHGALKPGAILWGFEPNRENYHATCLTRVINSLSNVKLSNAALWAHGGAKRIRTVDRSIPLGGGSTLVGIPENCPPSEQFEVTVVALDDVIPAERKVSLIQLDVEGSELEALKGGLRTIRRCTPLLVLETYPKDWIEENLMPLGYTVAGTVHGNTIVTIKGRNVAVG